LSSYHLQVTELDFRISQRFHNNVTTHIYVIRSGGAEAKGQAAVHERVEPQGRTVSKLRPGHKRTYPTQKTAITIRIVITFAPMLAR